MLAIRTVQYTFMYIELALLVSAWLQIQANYERRSEKDFCGGKRQIVTKEAKQTKEIESRIWFARYSSEREQECKRDDISSLSSYLL